MHSEKNVHFWNQCQILESKYYGRRGSLRSALRALKNISNNFEKFRHFIFLIWETLF